MRLALVLQLGGALALFTWVSQVAADTTVYRCTIDGVLTFSDRQCASEAQVQPIDTGRYR